MSRTVTALFDSRSEAEAAKSRLTASRIDADNVRIIDKSYSESGSSSGSSGESGGFFGGLKNLFLPDEDTHAYGEGINRGGFLLCAQVDEDEADEAIRILDESDSVDFDQRQDEWRGEGWSGNFSGFTDTGVPSGAGMGASGQGFAAGTGGSFTGGTNTQNRFESNSDEQHIPIVEEQLKVGKREITRGGARVRSYVREVPVHEQVNLREEHVSVERRPVDRTLSANELQGGDMLREQNIEMTETSEEAVVAKEARVREELVVRKTAEEHVENIDETVRRTEVDVDENFTGREDRPAFGNFGGGTGTSRGSDEFSESRTDFERTDKDRF